MTRRTCRALKELGCDGAIVSEWGGFEVDHIEGFEVLYRSGHLLNLNKK